MLGAWLLLLSNNTPTSYTASLTETIVVAEDLASRYTATISPAETVALSEGVGAQYAATVGPAETVALSEGVAALYTAVIAPAESVAVAEAIAVIVTATIGATESLVLAEALASTYTATIAPSEPVALSEQLASAYSAIVAPAESVGLAEALAAIATYAAGVAESITWIETVDGSIVMVVKTYVVASPGITTVATTQAVAATVSEPDLEVSGSAIVVLPAPPVQIVLIRNAVTVTPYQEPPMRQGDLLPPYTARAFTAAAFVDLTAFTSLTFRAVGPVTITGAATGDANGNLSYTWQAGQTATPGTYSVIFVGVDAQGREQTFPTDQNLTLVITPDL